MIASLVMGVGESKISQLLTFLDMPQNKFGKFSLPVVEDNVGKIIRYMALVEMNEGLREEIRATLDEERNEWLKKIVVLMQ
eukprot:8183659-Ditylum_brightwellii.AAC.1